MTFNRNHICSLIITIFSHYKVSAGQPEQKITADTGRAAALTGLTQGEAGKTGSVKNCSHSHW
jgi:hypothetical protein